MHYLFFSRGPWANFEIFVSVGFRKEKVFVNDSYPKKVTFTSPRLKHSKLLYAVSNTSLFQSALSKNIPLENIILGFQFYKKYLRASFIRWGYLGRFFVSLLG